MAKKNNFKYYEDDYERAVLEHLVDAGWQYTCGYDIHRQRDEIILKDDFQEYLCNRYGMMSGKEIKEVADYVTGFSNQSLYRSIKETYRRLKKGYNLVRDDGTTLFVEFFHEKANRNIFRVVNQFEFEEYDLRRPDIVAFINGIPVSVFELKNPDDETVTIQDAYEQTHITYADKIPSLMKFDFVNVISDGANTRYGALQASYEFYFKWNAMKDKEYVREDGIASAVALLKGLFEPATLLNVLLYYVFIPDTSNNNKLVLPQYHQYYGTEIMYKHVLKEYKKQSGKGGTYWGATGCGKSYIMLFLSKRITTSLELNKPTILLLTDRTELDDQLSGDFENAKSYLIENNCMQVANRQVMRQKLKDVASGGIYLMTIQKFLEGVEELSDRSNIFCISDEAHRTQTNTEAKYDMDEKKGAKKKYGFAHYLRHSFPYATYIGFTGTPVDATLRVFGGVVKEAKYTMRRSKEDGTTCNIGRMDGPREVQLDEKLAKACDDYYKAQAKAGANKHQIEQSKREMSQVKRILGNSDRLDVVVKHFIWHYEKRVEEHATVNGKAMFVCLNREIAFEVYKRIVALRPDWLVKRKCAPEFEDDGTDDKAIACEKVRLVCSNSKGDSEEFSKLIGTEATRKKLASIFKDDKSNLKIVVVVDMWITGFNVPSLDTMYIDKPLETHNLIQTLSRGNRNYLGKEECLIVDYIGLKNSILEAMKQYEGDLIPVNGVSTSLAVFHDFISKLVALMNDFDYSRFFDESISPKDRLDIIQRGVEFVMKDKHRENNFMGFVHRAKKSYDICMGHEDITDEEVSELHFFMCVRSVIFKMTKGDTDDTTLMNKKVGELVDKAISSVYSGKTFKFEDEVEDIEYLFSDEFIEKLKKIKYPNTKFQALIKLLKRAIKEFSRTNLIKSQDFSKRLKRVIDRYNERNEITEVEEVLEETIERLTDELENIHKSLQTERNSFVKMGITYDEKAFYDILVAVAEKYGFKSSFTEEKFIELSKSIKTIVSNKSKYTDWTNRGDVKAELYSEVAVMLKKNGYPPSARKDAYEEIMKQVGNFKKNEEIAEKKQKSKKVAKVVFLSKVEDSKEVTDFIGNLLEMSNGMTLLDLQKECIDQFGERYAGMAMKDWYHVVRDYVAEKTHRENILPNDVIVWNVAEDLHHE